MWKRYRVLLVAALAVLLGDQLTKLWALGRLTTALDGDVSALRVFYGAPPPAGFDGLHFRPNDRIVFSGDLVALGYVENKGAAFGSFSNVPEQYRAPLFHLVSIGAVLLALYYWGQLRGARDERLARVGLPLVLGGALGNVVDRVTRGFVIDFIDVHWGERLGPAFNLADAALVTGVALLFVDAFVRKPSKA